MRKSNSDNRFMTVRKVPEYLQINDKGINALATKEKNTRDKKINNGCYHVNWSISRYLYYVDGGDFAARLVICRK